MTAESGKFLGLPFIVHQNLLIHHQIFNETITKSVYLLIAKINGKWPSQINITGPISVARFSS